MRIVTLLTVLLPAVCAPLTASSQISNAQDPSNWEILDPELDGDDHYYRKEWVTINNSQQLVDATYDRDWSTGSWTRNNVPIAGEPPFPFHAATTEPHTLTAAATGSVTVRLKWKHIGIAPPPIFVNVIIHSSCDAYSSTSDTFERSTMVAYDGLSHTNAQYDLQQSPFRKYEQGRYLVTLAVSQNGIAEYSLTKAAYASCAVQLISSLQSVAIQANYGAISVLGRTTDIVFNGGQYRAETNGLYLERNLPKLYNDHHDSLQILSIEPFQYAAARSVPNMPVYSATSSQDTYVYARPTATWSAGSGGTPPQTRLSFQGYAATEHIDEESYQWQSTHWSDFGSSFCAKSHSHNSYSCDPSYLVESIVPYTGMNFLVSHQLGNKRWTSENLVSESSNTISLTYTWPATTTTPASSFVANRTITLVEPRLTLASSNIVESEAPGRYQVYFPDFNGYWVPHGNNHLTANGSIGVPKFDRGGIEYWSGHVADLGGLWGESTSKKVTATAVATSLIANFTSDDSTPLPNLTRVNPNSNYTWWRIDNTEYLAPPLDFLVSAHTYEWTVFIRPLVNIQALVYNSYNMQGFRGRYIEVVETEQPLTTGRYLYMFKKNSQGTGSGGSGGEGLD